MKPITFDGITYRPLRAPWLPARVRLIWHALLGHPIAYRMTVNGGSLAPRGRRDAYVGSCTLGGGVR